MNRIAKLLLAGLLLGALSAGSVSAAAQNSRLEDVRKHGQLRCGVNPDLPGFAVKTAGDWQGFDVDMCRAVAVSVFGDAGKVEFVPVTTEQRISKLAKGEVDLVANTFTWNLSRDVGQGISFAATYFYDGQGFMVRRERDIISALELEGAKVCVTPGTTSARNLADYFRFNRMTLTGVAAESAKDRLDKLLKDECDVVTGDHSSLHALKTTVEQGAQLKILPEMISKEPLSLAVPAGDDSWRKLVQWTLFALINAEELGLTQANVEQAKEAAREPSVRRFLGVQGHIGDSLGLRSDWGYQLISQLGNYGEIFERNLGSQSALKIKRGLNAPWSAGGLLYAPPIN